MTPDLKGEIDIFQKECPISYDRICGRKYHVPNYRQGDYYNQDLINHLWISQLIAYGSGLYGFKDEVSNTAYASFSQLIAHYKPTYFLEKELGDAFVRTKLPLDMIVDDIEWKHEAMRIMLPKGCLTIEREGQPRNMLYLDIARVSSMQELMVPVELRLELNAFVKKFVPYEARAAVGPHPFSELCGSYTYDGYIIVGHLDYHEISEMAYVVYAVIKPWGEISLKDLFDITDKLQSGFGRDNVDDRFLLQMEQLGLTILLYMGATPIEYESEILRKKQIIGKRQIPELAAAKFVGSSQVRARTAPAAVSLTHFKPTGRTLPPHAVAGHWKRVVYGPKGSLRKLAFIHPYLTGNIEDQNEHI